MRVMVPLIIATVALLGAGAAAGLCWKHSKSLSSLQKVARFIWRHVTPLVEFIDVSTLIAEQPRPLKETLDNQQNAETQRERYYATIHKVALQAGGDKIPGNSGLATYVWTNLINLWALWMESTLVAASWHSLHSGEYYDSSKSKLSYSNSPCSIRLTFSSNI